MGDIDSQDQPLRGWEHFHHVADVGVRGVGETLSEGKAFVCGTRGDTLEAEAKSLADGNYHVFEVGEFDVTDDMMMYIALSRPTVAEEVYLDCLWLEPVAVLKR